MGKTVLVVGSIALATLLAYMGAATDPVSGAGKKRAVTLVGAGDIARCKFAADRDTARLLGETKGTVFTLGDNAYPDGTAEQFRECYDPTWGKYKRRTKPAAGNHEYNTSEARPYFDYFGRKVGKPGRGYYAYDRGSWHIVVLNSNCEEVACGARSRQVRWLRRNLAKHRTRCTLAYFHHPLFSSGEHGNQKKMRPTWNALYAANAEVVVSGHDHSYERFAPQKPDGSRDAVRGIREFVVGTGGGEHYPFGEIEANSQVRNAKTFGVLKLTLHSNSYAWKFVPVAGKSFTDSGFVPCH
jgi:acid phosphatase type 7